ncbi:MAG: acyltransferase [Nannocystaceae bacterium]
MPRRSATAATTRTGGAPDFAPSIKQRIAGLDELRGIAILCVVGVHAALVLDIEIWGVGAWAVDLFFVISGYLICSILLRTRVGYAGYYRNFYVRRWFRIFPLSFVLIALGVIASHLTGRTFHNVLIYYLTFTQNFIEITAGVATNAPNFSGALLGCATLWSLAVEEQFYLVLPLAIRALRRERLPWLICATILIGLANRYLFFAEDLRDAPPYANPWGTHLRVHYLALGCLLALTPSTKLLAALGATWLALVLLARPSQFLEFVGAVVIVSVVARTLSHGPLLTSRPLAHLGKLCFGLYCLHWPIVAVVRDYVPIPAALGFALVFPLSYGAALLSSHYFELPLLRQRTRFEHTPAPPPSAQANT